MEPLKPETKKSILQERPQASPADIAEYERLLAERYTIDPDQALSPQATAVAGQKDNRLAELFTKLFG